jgi:hypothetical protein
MMGPIMCLVLDTVEFKWQVTPVADELNQDQHTYSSMYQSRHSIFHKEY